MNLDALWHDLECGAYSEDLPLWRALAAEAGGPVLDVGAGTGRVTLDLAARGTTVVALDIDSALLEALEHRARGLSVETVVADARQLAVGGRRFSLVIVPMQTLQLLGGAAGRAAFLRRTLAHLEPGGLLAAAVADAMDCFDEERDMPPPPDACQIGEVRYASQLLSVVDAGARAAIHRRREIVAAGEWRESHDVVVELDRVSADAVAAEAGRLGFLNEPHLYVRETEHYLGSTVVVLRAPGQSPRRCRLAAPSTNAVMSFAASDRPMPLVDSERQVEKASAWRHGTGRRTGADRGKERGCPASSDRRQLALRDRQPVGNRLNRRAAIGGSRGP